MIDARTYLESFRPAESRLQLKIRQLNGIRERVLSITAPLGKELVSHTPNVGIMADTVAMIIDMENEVEKQVSDIMQRKREAYLLLDQMKPKSAQMLMDYYFEGKSLSEIGSSLHIVKRHAQRKLNEAIEEFQAVLDQNRGLLKKHII